MSQKFAENQIYNYGESTGDHIRFRESWEK